MAVLGVVINPAANGNRGRSTGSGVVAALTQAGHSVIDLSGPTAEQAQRQASDACRDRRVEALVLVGGDGMVHLGVNAAAGTSVPIGIVAIGSGNDFARSVGLPLHDGRAALTALEAALVAPVRPIDVLAASGPAGTRRTAGAISVGLDAAVNARANTYTFPPGGGKYIRAVFAELRGFRPYGYRLTLDGRPRQLAGTLVAIANSPYFGGGMKIAPHAVVDDGVADVVIADGLRPWQAMRIFPRLYAGTHLDHPAVDVVRARTITVEPDPGLPAPPEAYGDGERIGPLPLRIEVEAGAVSLLVPPVP